MFDTSSSLLESCLARGLGRRGVQRWVWVEVTVGASVFAHPVPPVVAGPVTAWDADPASMSPQAAIDALVSIQAQRARLDAAEAALLVRAAGPVTLTREVLAQDTDPQTGLPTHVRDPRVVPLREEAADEIAFALHRTVGQVCGQIWAARLLHGPLARTHALLAQGQITMAHANAITQQAARMATRPLGANADDDAVFADMCDQLQDRVLPYAAHQSPPDTRDRARRAVASIDPQGAAERRRRAKQACDVTARALDDGLALIEATMPALDAAMVMAKVETTVREIIANGTVEDLGLGCDATLGQIRATVFARLVRDGGLPTSCADDTAPTTLVEIGVLVDAATLTGVTLDGPVLVDVAGDTTDASRDDLITLINAADVQATVRRLVTDPRTGALVDRGANTYHVSAALRAWLVARDRRCTQPGCRRRAARCDVDHVVDFHDGGRTVIANTHLLCRRHHNAKTFGNWQITDFTPDGSYTVTSPHGYREQRFPTPLGPEPPPPPPPPPNDEIPPF